MYHRRRLKTNLCLHSVARNVLVYLDVNERKINVTKKNKHRI